MTPAASGVGSLEVRHDTTHPILVLGAGFAGLSAAVRLADAGHAVIVIERGPKGGGRASVFVDRETNERVDNGQHVLFGCYRETYAFLRRIGTEQLAPLQPSLTLAMAGSDGRVRELTCPSLRPPWHLMAGVLRWSALSLADRLGALRIAGVIRRARRHGAAAVAAAVPPKQTVTDWLTEHGQSRRMREWLWHPLAFAALNQSPDTAAAAPFVRVVAELFGPRVEDSAVGLARVPLDELYVTPAIRAIEARGGAVHVNSSARIASPDGGRVTHVETEWGTLAVSAVVSAVPWHALSGIWLGEPPTALAGLLSNAAAMTPSPIVTVNLWLDAPVLDRPFLGLVDGPMHWVFDRRAIVGDQARHLSVVASGAEALAAEDNAAITAIAVKHLSAALPAMCHRRVLRSVVVREHRATFSLAPGGPARPGPVTPIPGFFLAGDWTDTALPATIEGAVTSGHRAADEVTRWLAQPASRAPLVSAGP